MTPTSPGSPQSTETYRVYKYFNGLQHVYADPLAVQRELTRLLDGAADRIVTEANSDDVQTAAIARDKLIAATRQAFNLAAFEPATGAGVVEEEVMRIWDEFNEWMDKKKAKPATSPTGFAGTGQPSLGANPYLSSNRSGSPSTSQGCGVPTPPR